MANLNRPDNATDSCREQPFRQTIGQIPERPSGKYFLSCTARVLRRRGLPGVEGTLDLERPIPRVAPQPLTNAYPFRLYDDPSATMPQKLTPEFIAAAIDGFQEQKKRIDDQIAELRQMLGASSGDEGAAPPRPTTKRRARSALVRARMAAAQRKRWAAKRTASAGTETKSARPRKKRRLSAAGRKAISEATKRRWAAVRAAGKR